MGLLTGGRLASLLVSTALSVAGAGISAVSDAPTSKTAQAATTPRPVRDMSRIFLHQDYRTGNWGKEGCCGHAVVCHLLHEAGHHDMAKWWRNTHPRPSYVHDMVEELNAKGYKSRLVTTVSQVEKAIAAGKPVGFTIMWQDVGESNGVHMITLTKLDMRTAVYIDPNHPSRSVTISREKFVSMFNRGGNNGMVVDLQKAPVL